MNGPTDRVTYRVACTQLKKAKYKNEISVSFDESEAVPMTIEIPIEAQKVRPLGPAPQGAPWSLLVVY